jgi:hypothetical protein
VWLRGSAVALIWLQSSCFKKRDVALRRGEGGSFFGDQGRFPDVNEPDYREL